jgi:muramoyltetrapeptide carboxypeptidase
MIEFSECDLPPLLKPGDLVKVIAPSGALKEWEAFEKGIEIWRSRGYHVELGNNCDRQYGYLAGTDEQRRQALLEAWKDPECKAILCTRGGYGGARLLENWSWHQLSVTSDQLPVTSYQSSIPSSPIQNTKWLIGFSDVTGLLWSLAKAGISGVHGPVLTTIAAEPDWSLKRLFDYLENGSLEPLRGKGWGNGQATGILLPANLTVATHLLGTFIQPSLDGVILALEDVTEAPYRIDRMLTQWRMCGAFERVKGIALGRFSRCDPPFGSNSWTIEEVLRDRLGDLEIPVVSELPFGHDGVNAALPVGRTALLDANRGILEILSLKV